MRRSLYMYKVLKPILFLFPPEFAHGCAMALATIQIKMLYTIGITKVFYPNLTERVKTKVFGIEFPNRLGLAAGFDKNGKYLDVLQFMGFGFVEVGTVTPRPQKGNPKPRLFRLPKDEALINRMGFNNEGVDVLADRLKNFYNEKDLIVGGNIGKNKDTPNENAVDDYLICFEKLHEYVDYFVVNVSSPNTPNLRSLQEKGPLKHILSTLQNSNLAKETQKPILLKIAPDLSEPQVDDIIEIIEETKIAGAILSNTTIDRSGLETPTSVIEAMGNGGLSGKPLRQKTLSMQKYFHQKSGGRIPFIGVGGIGDAESANNTLDAGASLIQIYTGFIYGGPKILKQIVQGLKAKK